MRCACSPSAPAWLEPAGLDLERLVLARLEPGLLDLVHDVAQVVGPPAHLVAPARQRRLLAREARRAPRAPRPPPAARAPRARRRRGCRAARRRGAATGSRAGRGGPPGARRAGRAPTAVVGLPLTHARERPSAETSRRTTTRPSSTSRPSASTWRAGAGVEALERALDDRLRGAGPDAAARGPLAEQQREGVDEHRLAGAGLAGEHVEAGAEVERHVGDGGEVADAELGEHGQGSGGRAVGRCGPEQCRSRA